MKKLMFVLLLVCSTALAYTPVEDCRFTFTPGWYILANSEHATHWEIWIAGTKRIEVPAFQTEGHYRTCWPLAFADFYDNKMSPNMVCPDNPYCDTSGILCAQIEQFLLPAGVHDIEVIPFNYGVSGDSATFKLKIEEDGTMRALNPPKQLNLSVFNV